MITSVKEILTKAKEGGYAVGAFNTVNLETTRAIVEAAKETKSPIIIQITESTMEYAGGRGIYHLIKNEAEFYAPEIPIGIHLDHGKSFEAIKHVIEIGLISVMYDGSRKKYEDNLSMTTEIADFCHQKEVAIQGELGSVPYLGESSSMGDVDWDEWMTDPKQAKDFVEKTKIDALAVAIGNAHGFFKERSQPDYDRLQKIHEIVSVPLVLHGASDWESEKVKKVIERGISCFNVDTAIRMAFINSLIKSIDEHGEMSFDVRKVLGKARDEAKEEVKKKIEMFGSAGKI